MDNDHGSTYVIIIGAFFAAFVSLVWVLQEEIKKRPTATQIFGRMGTAFAVGFLVGSIVGRFYPEWGDNILWGVCGAAGFFGQRVFVAGAVWVEKKIGVDLLAKNRNGNGNGGSK